jgi:hypothetical protein
LILVAPGPLQAWYREANTYPHLALHGVPADPDSLLPAQLQANAAMFGLLLKEEIRQKAVARLKTTAGRVLTDCTGILEAARQGNVETLFISLEDHLWGKCGQNTAHCRLHESRHYGDEDLLNRMAVSAYLSGAQVLAVEPKQMPFAGEQAAALLRDQRAVM